MCKTNVSFPDVNILSLSYRFTRTGKCDEIFLATKFGRTPGAKKDITGDPEYVKAAFEKSRQRLGVDVVDLYYLHRADTTVPIEVGFFFS